MDGPSPMAIGSGALIVAPSTLNVTAAPVAMPAFAALALARSLAVRRLTVLPAPANASEIEPPVALCAAPSVPGLASANAVAEMKSALNDPPNDKSMVPAVALAPVTGPAPSEGVEALALASRTRFEVGVSLVRALLEKETDPAAALPADAPPSPPGSPRCGPEVGAP